MFNSTVLDSTRARGLAGGMQTRWVLLCCLTVLAGCSALPEAWQRPFDGAVAYPALVPLDPLLAQGAALAARSPVEEGTELTTRADELRRRAALLQAEPF
jgi:hypothetical protein